jgi:hypothetical protein
MSSQLRFIGRTFLSLLVFLIFSALIFVFHQELVSNQAQTLSNIFEAYSATSHRNRRRLGQSISFLDPEIVKQHHPNQQSTQTTNVSSEISFLNLEEIKAKETAHLETLQKKKELKEKKALEVKSDNSNIHFLRSEKASVPTSSPTKTVELKKPPPQQPEPINIHFFGSHTNKAAQSSVTHVEINTNLDPTEAQSVLAHPKFSPREGSDISPFNREKLLNCSGQSKCIVPALELQKKYKIYFCKHPVKQGVRFYFISREGLYLHPNVELVKFENIHQADYIIYLPGSAPWSLSECNQTAFGPRLIVLDEFDGHTLVLPSRTKEEYIQSYGSLSKPWYFLYFKRSFVRRADGMFLGYPHIGQYETFPMIYSVAEAYVSYDFNTKRDVEILCTLRGHAKMTTRLRVQSWVGEYGKTRNITKIITGEVDTHQRTAFSTLYFQNMYNAKIIVTVNPAEWEGDFRLWESFGSGALIFVDPLIVPHPYPLVDGENVVYFSNQNKTELFHKLDYYRSHPEEARRVALNGYFHAMKYHRTVNLIDYILRTAHMKESIDLRTVTPPYNYTGQYLNYAAKLQEKMIAKCQKPGYYEPFPMVNTSHYLQSCE